MQESVSWGWTSGRAAPQRWNKRHVGRGSVQGAEGHSGWAWVLLISTLIWLSRMFGSHFFFFFFFFHVAHSFLLLSPLPLSCPSFLCKPLCFSSFSSRLFFFFFEEEGMWAFWRQTNKQTNKSNKCLLLKREQPLTIGILGERQQNVSWTHFLWGKLYLQLTITFYTRGEMCETIRKLQLLPFQCNFCNKCL